MANRKSFCYAERSVATNEDRIRARLREAVAEYTAVVGGDLDDLFATMGAESAEQKLHAIRLDLATQPG